MQITTQKDPKQTIKNSCIFPMHWMTSFNWSPVLGFIIHPWCHITSVQDTN